MAPKMKAATGVQPVAEEPVAKKQKTEEEADAAEDDKSGEREADAPRETRTLLKEVVGFDSADLTLNVIPTLGGRVLTTLADGGMQFLIAGARANTGVKAGRYLFEIKVIESLNPQDGHAKGSGRPPMPRQLVRIGFSAGASSLILGEGPDGICFDSEGAIIVDRKKSPAPVFSSAASGVAALARGGGFGRDQVIGALLNLDSKSKNANTVSLFRDGVRVSEPVPLPDELKGRVLFPHIAFRNVSVQVHFGPEPLKPLPFVARSLQQAAKDDVKIVSSASKDGKYEVVLPVAFPDEGTFDWLDDFLEKNPKYIELSDRKIVEWAAQSGMVKQKGTSPKDSNDKPEFNYGIPAMDDLSVRRVIGSISPLIPRNYVVMEVKSNLIAEERKEILDKFSAPHFRRISHVVMGEPDDEFREGVQEKLLKEKQAKANVQWQAQNIEKNKQKQLELRQKQLEDIKKKVEEERAKKIEDAKKAIAAKAAAAAAPAGEKKEGEGEAKDASDAKDAEAEASTKEDVEMKAADEKKDDEEDEDKEPPKVELDDEEKKLKFATHALKDLSPSIINASFAKFTVPEKSEGFEDIRYSWAGAAASREYLRSWVLEQKRTLRIEELQPSKWFMEKVATWKRAVAEWQQKQKEWVAAAPAKALAEKAKDGEEVDDPDKEKPNIDIFSVENVCDVGNGEPLFASFGAEDWKLLELRYELYLLTQGFKKDVDDPDRPAFHETHLVFYYGRYYRRQISPQHFGKESNKELCEFVKDTISVDSATSMVGAHHSDDVETPDILLKLTEESRRERQRRLDAGDETARLKFTPLAYQVLPLVAAPAPVPTPSPQAAAIVDAAQTGQWKGAGGKGWQQPGASGKGWGKDQKGFAPRFGKPAGK